MPRADLHNALVLDNEIYEAAQVDPTLLDPVIRTSGALPGTARAFTVLREYQGPQGAYVEYFVITDRTGREVARSGVARVELTGEMFEDRFTTTLRDVQLRDGDEHLATFFIDDEEVGAIPVFVESAMGGDPRVAAELTFAKAVQKGTVLWVTVPQPGSGRGRKAIPASEHTQAVWFVYDKSRVYVLNGPTEQQVPHLLEANSVVLTARSKDHRSEVSNVRAGVRVLASDDADWERIARTGLGRRLNLPDGDGALERWKANCDLVELTPHFRDESENGDAPAPARPAATATEPSAAAAAPSDAAEAGGDAKPAAAATAPAQEDVHVVAQVDQSVYDELIAEGKSERVARAKAKAAYVRAEKARHRGEQGDGAEGESGDSESDSSEST